MTETRVTAAGSEYSRYIVYVDESGDHGPVSAEYPMFVLAFCIFNKTEYANTVTSYMHRLKFKHFGHDTVVMHEREIRKARPPFSFLMNAQRRAEFMNDVSAMIEAAPFTLIAVAIHKAQLAERYPAWAKNPYHLALKFGLERIGNFRAENRDTGRLHVVFESRGRNEDRELELEFRRMSSHEPVFSKKDANHCGLQLADLVARPIGLRQLKPSQPNRAYDVLEKKFRSSPHGKIEGWGLKCFP